MTARFKLFHAHTACTRVTLTALEQCGVDYDDQMLDMMAGEHRREAFLAINPQGKVPALMVDGKVLTENGAILTWLNREFPEAGLFPTPADDWQAARQLSDLFWLSSSWHPYVRANKVPFLWTTGDVEPVREKGRELLLPLVHQLEDHLSRQDWWYAGQWSIIDAYLWWACINAEIGGFPLDGFEAIGRWRERNEAHPALRRALAREESAYRALRARA